jgi:hypothetical protein
MGWDPSVLRKYNTTGHFRLLSQLRSELKSNPLVRPKEGQTIGEVNRSKGLIRAMEARGTGRSRRAAAAAIAAAAFPVVVSAEQADGSRPERPMPERISAERHSAERHGAERISDDSATADQGSGAGSFRDRLNAIDLR